MTDKCIEFIKNIEDLRRVCFKYSVSSMVRIINDRFNTRYLNNIQPNTNNLGEFVIELPIQKICKLAPEITLRDVVRVAQKNAIFFNYPSNDKEAEEWENQDIGEK